ncbi:hypothetical protein Mesau_03138 [Mesorhizobium australicum WSM2073]|uniref:Uncharacterized protein n=1 Tax=Mesorhizobium australicum (strain HAMBI 3006 / LMG 24608 / WSM2073) TaxID=754035 RepID=L0KN35_MESAW|nr:hypothetical protein Mesau_03138 [Mesorhizobium australicum WSM2073]
MSLEPGLVLGRAAPELDWSEKQRVLRALWQFGVIGGASRCGTASHGRYRTAGEGCKTYLALVGV